MIAQLTGTVLSAEATSLLVDVQGVGYHVRTTAPTASGVRVGERQTIFTTLIVREDSLSLWGFSTAGERDAFELVQSASGVGPKVAAAMLSVFSPGELRDVILREDARRLTSVPGIGPKGAQRIIIELKDRVLTLSDGGPGLPVVAADDAWRAQVADGLQGLGWSMKEADRACDAVSPLVADDPSMSIAALMRAALSVLAKK
ncbi:Holliday junction branch migration protein RuvA [Tessaracoccus sp. OH4464_COT-324]|uniref:Holliday junction branch migration protein RuvA n=1 Tax=Tessaracoccus sp. OH4464_COT-324 TaxID=2491059 RepID=UPI000F637164|nr:Holliday junction branch migration protein RuvA [Tessaracoccus sp. OH4464_COT-324]RRD47935.1 Holliday junction branch migration protein RuvA [Tessaracoccus sp. OH4464_COT-324]